jgi:hypothetical protein
MVPLFLRRCPVILLWLTAPALMISGTSHAQTCSAPVTICAQATVGAIALIADDRPIEVVVDADADPAVMSAAKGFADDLSRVAKAAPAAILNRPPAAGRAVVLIGEVGHSPLIDGLIAGGRIQVSDIKERWEAYKQVIVDAPFPGIARALIIVGADRRGTVFGTYDLSEKIGVSPWHWWADVPVPYRANLFLTAGSHIDAPKVKYRGIFINDEEPSFGKWGRARFGGINAKLYSHVFDLILRLKGNYLWPAMWGKAIGVDDPATMPLAQARGIILGTSHHEPMTRAQVEWHRGKENGITGGPWSYVSNPANLRTFWRGGIERMVNEVGANRPEDQLVTIGMRGDGDEPMSDGNASGLLERIVADQRAIIAQVTRRPASQTPQVWALYKEVQDYHDKGLDVPDDVTLLFADDNWGQVRRLPAAPLDRSGGYGVYYHFDYVGGPRSYKWLNSVQIEKVWQQMDLSYRRDAKQLWIANVGDLKPMEFPTSFFMKMAWNPDAMDMRALGDFAREWAAAQFGDARGPAIGQLIQDYSRLAARRKPELVDADSFALGPVSPQMLGGGPFGAIVGEWDALESRMFSIGRQLPTEQRDAWFQLVEYPIAAMTNLYHLHYAVAWNRRLAALHDPRADSFADLAEAAFRKDKALVDTYHQLNGGKWNGMMSQTKIGYTSWNDPKTDVMPTVSRVGKHGAKIPMVRFAPVVNGSTDTVDAADFIGKHGSMGLEWTIMPGLGQAPAGALVALPQGRPATSPQDGIRIDYEMTLGQGGDAILRLSLLPTLDTSGGNGLRVGVSVDGGAVKIATMNLKVDGPDWTRAVKNNGFTIDVPLGARDAGRHRISLWRIDDNVVVERLALLAGPQPESSDISRLPTKTIK